MTTHVVVAWRAPNGAQGHGVPLLPDLADAWVKASNKRAPGAVTHWAAPVGDYERAEACARRSGPCDCGALAREALGAGEVA